MAQESNTKKVKVFSTPTCPWCTRVKEYLKEKNVTYENIDVSQDYEAAQRMVAKSGQSGVPQLWIDDEVVVGFNQPLIDQLLGLE